MDEAVAPSFGGYHYDNERGDFVNANGEVCTLRRRSFEVLRYLAQRPNQLVLRDVLFTSIGRESVVTEDSLTQCISEIRKALLDKDFKVLKILPNGNSHRFDIFQSWGNVAAERRP